jgi:hypothetical protein
MWGAVIILYMAETTVHIAYSGGCAQYWHQGCSITLAELSTYLQ